MKMDLKMPSAKWRPFCPERDELILYMLLQVSKEADDEAGAYEHARWLLGTSAGNILGPDSISMG